MKATTLETLARLVGGQIVGGGNVPICGAATLADAQAGEITLVDRPEKADILARSAASAAVIPLSFPLDRLLVPAIQSQDVHHAFAGIVSHFRPPRAVARIGIHPAAFVSPSAKLAANVDIHAGATVGDDVEIASGATIHCGARIMHGCRIGEGVTIYPNVVLYENTIVGARSTIHAGVVLGCHGFGYRLIEGRHQPSAQLGYVQIGADVEIGAGTTIDRGTYGPTIVGDGTKIDDQVMIAHNCRIGRHNMICSQVGIAGSTSTGDYVVMAGQVGVRDHVRIGDRAVLGAKAGVSQDVPAGASMLGIPAIPEREQKIQFAALSKLPEMRRQLRTLQQQVESLQQALGAAEPPSGEMVGRSGGQAA